MTDRSKWTVPLLTAAAALVLGSALSAGTLALWHDEARQGPDAVQTGDLTVAFVGDQLWTETSADVATSPQRIDPEAFLVRPGDTFTVAQDVEVTGAGDNLNATVAIDAPDVAMNWLTPGDDLPIAYRLLDGGAPISDFLPLGATASLNGDDLILTGDELPARLTVELAIEFPATLPDAAGQANVQADVRALALGDLTATATQVREGEGFNQ